MLKFKFPKPATSLSSSKLGSGSKSKSKPTSSSSLISALKSSPSSLPQIHALALKSALLHSNPPFLLNSLLHLYSNRRLLPSALLLLSSAPSDALDTASFNILLSAASKSHRLDLARHLFDQIPQPDHISFTTMIQALSQNALPRDSLALFSTMLGRRGVRPNEVTFAAVLSSCCRLGLAGTAVHGLVVKVGLDGSVLVGTNLVHWYVVTSRLEVAKEVFDEMPERNTVTWNVMLNGFAKAGMIAPATAIYRCPLSETLVGDH